jgi:hypothetical protein
MATPARPVSFLVLMIFVILLILGINLEEVPVVLEKAASICLSCIGIG